MVSKYSKYYGVDKNDPSRLMCLTCHITMKRAPRNATSGLRRHLATHHREQFMELTRSDEMKAMEMTEEANRSLQLCKDSMMEEARHALALCGESMDPMDSICSQWSATESEEPSQLNKAVLRCIVEEGIPISFFDSPAAQDLLSLASSGQYNLPPSSHFTTVEIPEAYEKLKGMISKTISECPFFSITADGLSREGPTEHVVLTAHWLSNDFEKKKAVIKATKWIEDFHGLREKVLKDIPQNNVRFLINGESFSSPFNVLLDNYSNDNLTRGFDTTINECVDDLLCDIDGWQQTYEALKKICEFLQGTTLAKEDYIVCLQLAELFDTVKKGTSDSWSSIYQLCERFLDAQSLIEHILGKYKDLPPLTGNDWKKIEMTKKLLKPYNDAAKVIHYSNKALISTVIPFIRVLLMGYGVNNKGDGEKQETFDGIAHRLSDYLKMEPLQITTVLDPRFKLNFALDGDTVALKEKVLRYVEDFASKEKQERPIGHGMQMVKSEPGQLPWLQPGTSNSDNTPSIDKELELYLSERVDMSTDPLEYWRQNKRRFPRIAGLARGYLSCTTNNLDTDDLNTAAETVWDAMGSQSSPETFEKLLFLKVNSGLFPTQYNSDFNMF